MRDAPILPGGLPDLVCPRDGTFLQWGGGGLRCETCRSTWPREGNIPVFSKPQSYWGEIPTQEMEPLLQEAEAQGWEKALRKRLLPEDGDTIAKRKDSAKRKQSGGEGAAPRGRFLFEYATDPSRADWRFLLPLTERSKVLDIGAGWGALTMALAPEVGAVVATDEMAERARFVDIRARQSGFANVFPIAAPAHLIPFPDGVFDLVILNGVLEWVGLARVHKNPRQVQLLVLKEIARKLAPGGHVYIGIENRYGYHYFFGVPDDHTKVWGTNLLPRSMANAVMKMRQGKEYRAYTHSYGGIRRLLKEAGFSTIHMHAAIPTYRRPKDLLPLSSTTVFDFYCERYPAFSAKRRMKVAAAKALYRAGILQRLAPHFAIVANQATPAS